MSVTGGEQHVHTMIQMTLGMACELAVHHDGGIIICDAQSEQSGKDARLKRGGGSEALAACLGKARVKARWLLQLDDWVRAQCERRGVWQRMQAHAIIPGTGAACAIPRTQFLEGLGLGEELCSTACRTSWRVGRLLPRQPPRPTCAATWTCEQVPIPRNTGDLTVLHLESVIQVPVLSC